MSKQQLSLKKHEVCTNEMCISHTFLNVDKGCELKHFQDKTADLREDYNKTGPFQ